MQKLFWIILIIILFSCSPKKESKEVPENVTQYTIEQFYANEQIYADGFSPDESKILAVSNKTGIYNAVALPVDGSEREQLTNSQKESIFIDSYFPEDERIIYHSDKGGNEIDHIYVRNLDGSAKDLTPWDSVKSDFAGWARDEKSMFFISNKRDHRFFDLYEMDTATFAPKMIYENSEGLDVAAISKDKRYLALVKSITTNNNEMFLFDRQTKKLIHISEHQGDINYNPQFFDLKTQYLYYLTDEGSEYNYLKRYNLETGESEKVWETNWDVWYAYNSYNEKYRVIGVNENARTKIYLFDLSNNQQVPLPDFGEKSIVSVGISKSEKLLRLSVASSDSPDNIYVYNFDTKELKQLTHTLNPEINPEDLVQGKAVNFKSFDGMEIPAIYYQPIQSSHNVKVPGLIWVHGGPGGQSRLSYFALIQYLVNHGYAILAVNNRGSGGYGKSFFKMDDQKHGDVDLKDCIAGKNFLDSTQVVDRNKIGIIGGSYGGYMVMQALTSAPDSFAVGVDLFGVTNWLRTLRSIPPYWESFKKALYEEMGNPYTSDSVMLYNISPLFHAKNVKNPVMVLQGANDPRVLKVESDEIVRGVKADNVPVEYVVFDDEGHGFVKKDNEISGYKKILEFLNKYLKGEQNPT